MLFREGRDNGFNVNQWLIMNYDFTVNCTFEFNKSLVQINNKLSIIKSLRYNFLGFTDICHSNANILKVQIFLGYSSPDDTYKTMNEVIVWCTKSNLEIIRENNV